MCLKKMGITMPRFYKTDNLYIGVLGYVTEENGQLFITNNEKKFIIYRKVKISMWGDYAGIDIFTGKKYFFSKGNIWSCDTIDNAIDNYAIYKSFPIDQFLDAPRRYVSKKQLLQVYNKLNKPRLETPKKDNVTVTDSILKTILETNQLVKNTLMDEKTKEGFIRELDELASYYVNKMTELSKIEGTNLTLSLNGTNEYSIKMEVIGRLADIDMRIKDPDIKRNYQLRRELQEVKQRLGS